MSFFNQKRIDETAEFIAKEIEEDLSRMNPNSHISQRIRDECPAYRSGLTNVERVVATLQALSKVQRGTIADLTSLTFGEGDEEVEEAEEMCLRGV
jgi:hypothetical protein